MTTLVKMPQSTSVNVSVKAIGLLLGLAAATPGIAAPIPGLPVRPWHAFVLLAVIIGVLSQSRIRGGVQFKIMRLDIVTISMMLFFVFLEVKNGSDLNYSPDYVAAARPLFWLMAYWSARMVLHTSFDAKSLLTWFVVPAFPSVLLGIAQILGVTAVQLLIIKLSPGGTGFINRLEGDSLLRATGFVQHWTLFGSYLCTIMAAAGALLILARINKIGGTLFAWCALCAAGIGCITTFTLAPIITAFCLFVISCKIAKVAARMVPIILGVALVSALSFGSFLGARLEQQFESKGGAGSSQSWEFVPSTLMYRYKIWTEETIPMIQERPLTGWGAGVYDVARGTSNSDRIYPRQLAWPSPESEWFGLLMSSGVLGLAGFLLIFYFSFNLLVRSRKWGNQWVATPVSILFALMIFSAFTAPVLTSYGLPLGLWTLLGVASKKMST